MSPISPMKLVFRTKRLRTIGNHGSYSFKFLSELVDEDLGASKDGTTGSSAVSVRTLDNNSLVDDESEEDDVHLLRTTVTRGRSSLPLRSLPSIRGTLKGTVATVKRGVKRAKRSIKRVHSTIKRPEKPPQTVQTATDSQSKEQTLVVVQTLERQHSSRMVLL